MGLSLTEPSAFAEPSERSTTGLPNPLARRGRWIVPATRRFNFRLHKVLRSTRQAVHRRWRLYSLQSDVAWNQHVAITIGREIINRDKGQATRDKEEETEKSLGRFTHRDYDPAVREFLMSDPTSTTEGILQRIRQGDSAAAGELFDLYHERLKQMVRLRMDRRLQGRLDASDAMQEAFMDVADRAAEYANDPKMPVYLRLRFLTGQKLLRMHRQQLGTQMRNADMEVSPHRRATPGQRRQLKDGPRWVSNRFCTLKACRRYSPGQAMLGSRRPG